MSQGLTQKRKDQITAEILKLRREPENLRCVDCSNRNCSYVCTNFSTFICSDCAGLYRKHCFRVKSCTVATFTEKELENLKTSGGNEESNRKYMARWKKKAETPIPKMGDMKGLDEFIRRKYVKKEWFKEKKKRKKKKKAVNEGEKKDSESKTKTKVSAPKETKPSKDDQLLERNFLASESAAPKADDEWDPWGEKSNVPAKPAPVAQAPQADFLADFSFNPAPAVETTKSADDWNPFGTKPAAAAPPGPSSQRKPTVDLMTELISDIQVTKPQNGFGVGMMASKEAPPAPKPVQQKPKVAYNDPFSTLVNNVPASASTPAVKTSPMPQVRAAPQPVQQPPPMHYPMYMNTYAQQYNMAQPPAQMNPYAPQYNMAAQQPMNPFGAQMPSNAGPMIPQNMPYAQQAPAHMNAYGYQLSSFDVTPASQVSQDNPFS